MSVSSSKVNPTTIPQDAFVVYQRRQLKRVSESLRSRTRTLSESKLLHWKPLFHLSIFWSCRIGYGRLHQATLVRYMILQNPSVDNTYRTGTVKRKLESQWRLHCVVNISSHALFQMEKFRKANTCLWCCSKHRHKICENDNLALIKFLYYSTVFGQREQRRFHFWNILFSSALQGPPDYALSSMSSLQPFVIICIEGTKGISASGLQQLLELLRGSPRKPLGLASGSQQLCSVLKQGRRKRTMELRISYCCEFRENWVTWELNERPCGVVWCLLIRLTVMRSNFVRTPESPPKCLIPKSQIFAISIRTKIGDFYPFFGSILGGGRFLSAPQIRPKNFPPRFAGHLSEVLDTYIPCSMQYSSLLYVFMPLHHPFPH